MDEQPPLTRWERAGERNHGYDQRFTALIAAGDDIDGEARLADVLAPRGARMLDAGAGLGRVGAALQRRGHRVTAVEKDGHLIGRAHELFPELPVIESDVLALTPELLEAHGAPSSYDVVVLVGNVIVLAAEDTEVRMLRTLGALLVEGGRMLVGFHHHGGPAHAREYPWDDFAADVTAAGLSVEQHFGSYDLRPPDDDYVVAVLTRG
ncbi:class I SAM-dependent methyltransferase [Nocardioides terrisoli]|uniref:class I SAM-dependent methyltransferase n=1 Tax=Nocardioides terrisoli TaxID=3388267 RepID=UPI00287BB751|nr:methyltransferase domain-containing protein [Nocardioides marmorisolisilvae]